MNSILKTNRNRLVQIASSGFIVAALALAVSGLLAQSSPQQSAVKAEATKRGPCQKWADDLKKDKPKAEKMRKALVTALKESAKTTPEGTETRRKLLDSPESAKAEVLRIFNADQTPPIFDANFPVEAWFKFYEPELPMTKEAEKTLQPMMTGPNREDHCLHIFRLPDSGTDFSGFSDKTIFASYIMCCYQPW
jgi:hypothetical protein